MVDINHKVKMRQNLDYILIVKLMMEDLIMNKYLKMSLDELY